MITKAGWHFADNMSVPGSIAFDHELFGHVSGSTWSWRNRHYVELYVDHDREQEFLEDFAHADWMTLTFDSGDEGAWSVDMTGSRDASNSFRQCIGNTNRMYGPATQPVGEAKPPAVPSPAQPVVEQPGAVATAWPKWLPLKGQ
jgi:hypothetical protein